MFFPFILSQLRWQTNWVQFTEVSVLHTFGIHQVRILVFDNYQRCSVPILANTIRYYVTQVFGWFSSFPLSLSIVLWSADKNKWEVFFFCLFFWTFSWGEVIYYKCCKLIMFLNTEYLFVYFFSVIISSFLLFSGVHIIILPWVVFYSYLLDFLFVFVLLSLGLH